MGSRIHVDLGALDFRYLRGNITAGGMEIVEGPADVAKEPPLAPLRLASLGSAVKKCNTGHAALIRIANLTSHPRGHVESVTDHGIVRSVDIPSHSSRLPPLPLRHTEVR